MENDLHKRVDKDIKLSDACMATQQQKFRI